MKVGTGIPHTGRLASPEFIRDYCQTAEDAGFASLWAVDHVVMPPHTDSLYTLSREPARIGDNAVSQLLSPMYEMTSTLLWVAGFTRKALLGTAVAVLPLRNPVLNARMLATLDVYSGGRLIYGAGVGWLREEAEAMQMPWDRRGARAEEHVAAMRTLWSAESSELKFEGTFYRFGAMDPEPRPVQRPSPPILIGGHSDVALDRAARIGDGWIAGQMSAPRVAERWSKVQALARGHRRDSEALILSAETEVAVGGADSTGLAEPIVEVISRCKAFKDAGVDHLRLLLRTGTKGEQLAALRTLGRELLPALHD